MFHLPADAAYSAVTVFVRKNIALFMYMYNLKLYDFDSVFSSFQTVVLTCLKKTIGLKNCVLIGLIFEILQLSWYGLGTQFW